jgi:hypothetical protein
MMPGGTGRFRQATAPPLAFSSFLEKFLALPAGKYEGMSYEARSRGTVAPWITKIERRAQSVAAKKKAAKKGKKR